MVFVWGKKWVRGPRSQFRASCLVCGVHGTQQLRTVRLAEHFYFIAFGGIPSHHEVLCLECGALTPRDLSFNPSTAESEQPHRASAADVRAELANAVSAMTYAAQLDDLRSHWLSLRAVLVLVMLTAAVPAFVFSPEWTEGVWTVGTATWVSVFAVSTASVILLSAGMRRLKLQRVVRVLRRAFAARSATNDEITRAIETAASSPGLHHLSAHFFE